MQLLERERELSHLAEAAASAIKGRGRIVLVRGEAGLGKTSLIRSLVEAERYLEAFIGRCDDSSIPLVLGPFKEILVDDARGRHRIDVDEAREGMVALLSEPAIVVIEDLHWADEASIDLIAYIAKRMGDAAALLVLTMRHPDNPHLLRCLAQIPADVSSQIELQPLSREAVGKLAAAKGRSGEDVLLQTGGNPFLVAETLAAQPEAIPMRVSYAASARLAVVSDSGAQLAGLLSSFPAGVSWQQLEGIWSEPVDLIDELEHAGLVEASTSRVGFRHELMRRSIEQGLTVASRRRFNEQILAHFDTETAEPAVVAHHAYQAGDLQRFTESTIVAARDFARVGAHRDALRHLERVEPHAGLLDSRDRARFTEALANELIVNNRLADADPIIHDAVEQWRDLGDPVSCAQALNLASLTTWHRGDAEQSLAEHREALALLENSSDTLQLVRTRVLTAQTIGLLSRWPEALAELDKAVAAASGIDPEVEAVALGARGNARRILGDESGGASDESRSIDIALKNDLPLVAMTSAANRVATSLGTLFLADVEDHLAEGLAHADRVESARGRFQLLAQAARLQIIRGRWDEALSTARELEELEEGPPLTRVSSVLAEGLIRVRRGDDEGLALIEQASGQASAVADIQRVGPVGLALAELSWLGKLDDSDRVLEINALAIASGHVRFTAEIALWCDRLGLENPNKPSEGPTAIMRELSGDWRGAAEAWAELGCPYHRLLALGFSGDPEAMREAVNEAIRFEAVVVADRLRADLRRIGHRVGRGPESDTLKHPGGLTRRQSEVVQLLAGGLSNQEIADTLFISSKTVDHHVSAILSKLDVSDRVAAGLWAQEHAAE